jgi:hypothetical protein
MLDLFNYFWLGVDKALILDNRANLQSYMIMYNRNVLFCFVFFGWMSENLRLHNKNLFAWSDCCLCSGTRKLVPNWFNFSPLTILVYMHEYLGIP